MASPLGRFGIRRAAVLSVLTAGAVLGVVTTLVLPAAAPAATAGRAAAPRSGASAGATAATEPAAPARQRKPKAATKTRKARHVPERPRDGKHGKRVVYDKALMTVWLMNKRDEVVARYPVVGRWDRPAKGSYRVFSKSPVSYNPESKVTFEHMVRFAPGLQTGYSIGFHAIPRYRDGKRMHSVDQLGLPIARGGCVRLSDEAAAHVYRFLEVGDRVVVLPSP